MFGFSFGISKAEVCVSKGKLLGHNIGRDGSSPDEERCQAVIDFPPLWEKLHIQQFLGCANWLRGYLPVEYGHAAKILGQWQKPGAVFPEGGLGSAATEGCKAFKAIKRMMQNRINLATFDEASAADGSCPLEQIADASGIAVGGSVVQMTRDLSQLCQSAYDTLKELDPRAAKLAALDTGGVCPARGKAGDTPHVWLYSDSVLDRSCQPYPSANVGHRNGSETRPVGCGNPYGWVRNKEP